MHPGGVLAIGEFSRLTHLSVRTLRRYHDAGLLEPATVDDATGYRYYSADQIPTAQVIQRLRELDVPLPDVQRILRSPDPGTRAAPGRRPPAPARVGAGPNPRRSGVAAPAAAAGSGSAGRRAARGRGDDGGRGGGRRRRTTRSSAGTPAPWPSWTRWCGDPTGVPGGLYDNALFEDGRGHVLVYRPAADPPRRGRVHPVTLPAVELAVTTHVGEHDDIDVTYGELGAWVVSQRARGGRAGA